MNKKAAAITFGILLLVCVIVLVIVKYTLVAVIIFALCFIVWLIFGLYLIVVEVLKDLEKPYE